MSEFIADVTTLVPPWITQAMGGTQSQVLSLGSQGQGVFIDPNQVTVQLGSPSAGSTFQINNAIRLVILTPAGLLSSLTVKMPPNPADGALLTVICTQILSSVTVSPNTNQSISTANPVTSLLSLGLFFSYIYSAATQTWYRCG